MWAKRWGIVQTESAPIEFTAFLSGALTAGTSPNGVFSVRVMWGSMEELVLNLSGTDAAPSGTDAEILNQTFGLTRFVWLRRMDTLAQAISWFRAEQTKVWHRLEGRAEQESVRPPEYDFDQIDALRNTIHTHNDAWQIWFRENNVSPLPITYEALDEDAAEVIARILGQLQLDTKKAREISTRNIRLADEVSVEWMARYRSDLVRRKTSP